MSGFSRRKSEPTRRLQKLSFGYVALERDNIRKKCVTKSSILMSWKYRVRKTEKSWKIHFMSGFSEAKSREVCNLWVPRKTYRVFHPRYIPEKYGTLPENNVLVYGDRDLNVWVDGTCKMKTLDYDCNFEACPQECHWIWSITSIQEVSGLPRMSSDWMYLWFSGQEMEFIFEIMGWWNKQNRRFWFEILKHVHRFPPNSAEIDRCGRRQGN